MKKRTLWIVLLCLALMLSGCGAVTEAGLEQERLADTSGTAAQVEQAEAVLDIEGLVSKAVDGIERVVLELRAIPLNSLPWAPSCFWAASPTRTPR